MFHIFAKEFEIVFQNRKWNYLNRKWNYFSRILTWFDLCGPLAEFWPNLTYVNYLNRKWNYFSHFQADDKKTTFTTIFSFPPRSSNWFSKQETELSKQNGIIYPTSGSLIKKLILQNVSHFHVVLCLSLSTLIHALSWKINLAQLISSSVALPAQLVPHICRYASVFNKI